MQALPRSRPGPQWLVAPADCAARRWRPRRRRSPPRRRRLPRRLPDRGQAGYRLERSAGLEGLSEPAPGLLLQAGLARPSAAGLGPAGQCLDRAAGLVARFEPGPAIPARSGLARPEVDRAPAGCRPEPAAEPVGSSEPARALQARAGLVLRLGADRALAGHQSLQAGVSHILPGPQAFVVRPGHQAWSARPRPEEGCRRGQRAGRRAAAARLAFQAGGRTQDDPVGRPRAECPEVADAGPLVAAWGDAPLAEAGVVPWLGAEAAGERRVEEPSLVAEAGAADVAGPVFPAAAPSVAGPAYPSRDPRQRAEPEPSETDDPRLRSEPSQIPP